MERTFYQFNNQYIKRHTFKCFILQLFHRFKLDSFASSNALIISSYLTNVSAIVDITSLYRSTSSNVDSFNLNSILSKIIFIDIRGFQISMRISYYESIMCLIKNHTYYMPSLVQVELKIVSPNFAHIQVAYM